MSAIPDHITRAAGIVEILTDETAVTLAALTIRRAICATIAIRLGLRLQPLI